MKQLQIVLLIGFLFNHCLLMAAINPFEEGEIKIEQVTPSSLVEAHQKIIKTTDATTISKADLYKAMTKLQEANENFSRLLKEFAKDPNRFANEKGDYQEFIKQLELISKKLAQIAKRLKAKNEKLKEIKIKDKRYKEVIVGTVRVNTSLNVRTGPWKRIIGSLYNGNKVKIIGEYGDWYKIVFNGKIAYIHKNYVNTSFRKAETTPVNRSNDNHDLQIDAKNNLSGGVLTAAPCVPMPNRVSSEFGYRIHPTLGYKQFHNGIDLPVPNGTRLNALGDGVVTAVGYEPGGGRYIKVKYAGGYESIYCHLKSCSVKKGQKVFAGQEIARSDNTGQWTTGPHLHFGLKKNGRYINPRSAGIPLP